MPELTWSGKDDAKKSLEEIPQRLLDFDSSLSYGDDSQNIIVHGDNLHVLKSLLPLYRSAVKCIYIDPPYNTGSAFDHYKDNFLHSDWLNLMLPRLILLKDFLADDGSIFVQIDNCEQAYLKILMDEIFGRNNFVNDIIWKRRGGSANPNNRLNNVTDYILWYSKSAEMSMHQVFSKEDENTKKYISERFKFKDSDGRIYMKSPIQSPNLRPNLIYEYKGYRVPDKGWSISKEVMEKWDREGRLAFPDDKSKTINRKIFLDEYKGQPVNNLWTDIFVINPMSSERINFDGQKPEALIQRILTLATNEGDMVLDAYLGSGTTAAVAHKMKRRYIGIEIGEQIITHVVPRLKKVIDGEVGGISKIENWTGGGGYKFYRLGGTITDKDGTLNSAVTEKDLASLIWFKVTKTPYRDEGTLPLIGVHNGKAYYLVENLTRGNFMKLPPHDGEKIIYGDVCKVGENFLRENKITFKQIPKALEE